MTSPIMNFYKNKSVFVTGGTGFLGKVLMEKLLYSCRDINSIFMHIKPKRGKNIDDRMNELFESPAFQRIHKENPTALRKIIPIAGNLREDQLGISGRDIATLHNEVSVVFHSAAVIKFDYNLKPCFEINTKGTRRLLDLCAGMKNLKSFVFVSTAYSNCPVPIIEEDVYETGLTLQQVDKFLKTADLKDCQKFIEPRPNAYALSKAMAEEMIAKEARAIGLPATIVRPTFIISSVKEPLPGWTENWYGWNSVVVAGLEGTLRIVRGLPHLVPGLVPVDYFANLCIASAWDTHRRREMGDKNVKVFNGCTSMQNGITQREVVDKIIANSRDVVNGTGRKPMLYIATNDRTYSTLVFLVETIRNYIIYAWQAVTGKKTDFLELYMRTRLVTEACTVFSINHFKFVDTNTKQLRRTLDERDAECFQFDMKAVQWSDCMRDYVRGVHKYVLGKS